MTKGLTRISVAATILILGAAAVVTGTQTDAFSGIFDPTDCQFEEVEINGQTFDSVEGFQNSWNQNSNTSFSQLEQTFDFEIRDGTLHYRTCLERGDGGGSL